MLATVETFVVALLSVASPCFFFFYQQPHNDESMAFPLSWSVVCNLTQLADLRIATLAAVWSGI
jgi:hypothetical protein